MTTGSFSVPDGRHIQLPRIGRVRTKEPTAELLSRVDAGEARVLSVTVSEQAGRWSASFTVDVERETATVATGLAVGADLGVKYLAVLSSKERVANPKHMSK